MENFSNKKKREFDESITDPNSRFQMYIEKMREQEKNTLTIRHFLSVRLIVGKIDFQKLYDEYIDAPMKDQIEESRTTDNLQNAKLHECILKQNEPTTEFIIKIIVENILDLCKENQFVLGLLNGQPHYFNNYYYVEINEILMRELLSDISKRNGVKNNEDYHFIDELYWSFRNELTPFSSRLKSYKERGKKLIKLPKRIINKEDYYFITKSYKKPSNT